MPPPVAKLATRKPPHTKRPRLSGAGQNVCRQGRGEHDARQAAEVQRDAALARASDIRARTHRAAPAPKSTIQAARNLRAEIERQLYDATQTSLVQREQIARLTADAAEPSPPATKPPGPMPSRRHAFPPRRSATWPCQNCDVENKLGHAARDTGAECTGTRPTAPRSNANFTSRHKLSPLSASRSRDSTVRKQPRAKRRRKTLPASKPRREARIAAEMLRDAALERISEVEDSSSPFAFRGRARKQLRSSRRDRAPALRSCSDRGCPARTDRPACQRNSRARSASSDTGIDPAALDAEIETRRLGRGRARRSHGPYRGTGPRDCGTPRNAKKPRAPSPTPVTAAQQPQEDRHGGHRRYRLRHSTTGECLPPPATRLRRAGSTALSPTQPARPSLCGPRISSHRLSSPSRPRRNPRLPP